MIFPQCTVIAKDAACVRADNFPSAVFFMRLAHGVQGSFYVRRVRRCYEPVAKALALLDNHALTALRVSEAVDDPLRFDSKQRKIRAQEREVSQSARYRYKTAWHEERRL